ncbi:uncharacterized protein LOC122320565 [Drosophila ficusphila]|uniref:uncharacterized protein LOC122320565 n=1 Tax=Drosophila ficusphila TaxID=30025 RepID=UPI001C88E40A|nr:uncharacterized protein LOC122320565 [Drosophila ficusphila]
MPKIYKQKPRHAWMQDPAFKDWLTLDPSDDLKCFCKYCKSSINAKLCDLQAHAKTTKHKSSASSFSQTNKITIVSSVSMKTSQKEAALCLYIATHSAVSPIDHLGLLCGNNFQDGGAMKLHRSKCTSVIKNILAPSFITLLKPDIGDAKYSLLLDESTDISVCKTLGVVINYFSLTRSTFLSIVPLEEGDAKTIANSLCQELSNFKLNLENLIGIGTDNASVKVPLKIFRVCDTRWLSIEVAVTRILKQWIELELHFNNAATNEKCFKAQTLHKLLNDDVHHLYLLFLQPELTQMQHITKIK